MSLLSFQLCFVACFCLGFFLTCAEASLANSLSCVLGLLCAFGLQRYFQSQIPCTVEKELDDTDIQPSFWVVLGVKMPPQENEHEENQFLSSVAAKRIIMNISATLIFLLVLLTNYSLGNPQRTLPFWLNVLMVFVFAKSITTFHYWLCLFLNVFATFLFFLTNENASFAGLFIYCFLILFIFINAKHRLSAQMFSVEKPASRRTIFKSVYASLLYTVLIFSFGTFLHWLLPNKKESSSDMKNAQAINTTLAKWLPKSGHNTPIRNWAWNLSEGRGENRKLSEEDQAQMDTYKRAISRELASSQNRLSAALRTLKRLDNGEAIDPGDLNQLQGTLADLGLGEADPNSPSSEKRATMRRALSQRMNSGGERTGAPPHGGGQDTLRSAARALEKLERGEEPSEQELKSLEEAVSDIHRKVSQMDPQNERDRTSLRDIFKGELEAPENKSISEAKRSLLEQAERELSGDVGQNGSGLTKGQSKPTPNGESQDNKGANGNAVAEAAQEYARQLNPATGGKLRPVFSPKFLSTLFRFSRTLITLAILFLIANLVKKLCQKRNPAAEKERLEEMRRAEGLEECLGELKKLKKAELDPREEIEAYYRLFLRMMSFTPFTRPESLPTESYSSFLEKNFPKENRSLKITNKLFCRALYSFFPISEKELYSFRQHIQVLFDLPLLPSSQ
jgi:hypothetical protein